MMTNKTQLAAFKKYLELKIVTTVGVKDRKKLIAVRCRVEERAKQHKIKKLKAL
jgi:hypothetical protein